MKQLAQMGATLANNGINPGTGEQVINADDIPKILATMTSRVSMTALAAGPGTLAFRRRVGSAAAFWRLSRARAPSLSSRPHLTKRETVLRRRRLSPTSQTNWI